MIHTLCPCCKRSLLTSSPRTGLETKLCVYCELQGHTTPCVIPDQATCSHSRRVGDNYGESCQSCGAQLSGFGYGGWFGRNLTGTTTCIHLFAPMGEDEVCIYCEEWKSNLEGGDS